MPMAISVQFDGPCKISVGTGDQGALEVLGYTVDGVSIRETSRTADVPGDQNGGTEGPPIDVQFFGQIHEVSIDMSKFDLAILNKLRPIVKGGTAGSISQPGTLLSGNSFRLLLAPDNVDGSGDPIINNPRNYLIAIPREPIEINKGTKFTRVRMSFQCHASAGVMYNATTT
jgi:hypothetical protein